MVKDLTTIRCPNKKRHKKKLQDMVISVDNCNSLVYFVDTSVNGYTVARKCSDCKGVITTEVRDNIAYVSVLGANTKIKTDTGKVVVE
jgi:hypothetical protein